MKETELWEILVSLSANEISLEEAHDQILRLFNVVRQSEQLKCHHQYTNAGILQGKAMKKCLKCGNYVKAL